MRISIQIARGAGMDLLPTFASSLFLHLMVILCLPFLPSFLPSGSPRPALYVVDLVELPPLAEPGGPAGGDAGGTPETAPEPAEQEPETPEPRPEPPPPEPEKPVPEPEPQPVTAKKEEPAQKPPVKEVIRRPPAIAPESAPQNGSPQPPDPGTAAGPAAPGGGDPGTGPGGGIGLPGSGGTPGFDDASFQYTYYVTRMVSILRSQWNKPIRPPGASGTLRSVVYFVIGRDGTILRSELEESSGYAALDMSALRAVRETRRMPPLPLQYDKSSLGVHFFFELKPEETAPSRFDTP